MKYADGCVVTMMTTGEPLTRLDAWLALIFNWKTAIMWQNKDYRFPHATSKQNTDYLLLAIKRMSIV